VTRVAVPVARSATIDCDHSEEGAVLAAQLLHSDTDCHKTSFKQLSNGLLFVIQMTNVQAPMTNRAHAWFTH
jgi:hypothetical protein